MEEKKYIELEAAISSLDELEKTSHHNSVLWPGHVEECREALRSIPAADVRPVITCRECKHWFENGTDYCSCDRDALLRERDFFCAAAEKREES